jgi:glycosyltransferase involved in cell wall biosynthesis
LTATSITYSLIIPVYERPVELDELLDSLTRQTFQEFEVIVVEDGSKIKADHIVEKYRGRLNIQYFYKTNSGPGLSRNYGAERAKGDFLLFFDSDCIIPETYLVEVDRFVHQYTPDAFGGPDKAHESFSFVQKAINYSMTSFLTTGGIRGGIKSLEHFKPRSFNMGLSRKVYEHTKGFAAIRFGEDVDLSLRIEKAGFRSFLIPDAWVYHKRRTNLKKFFKQVFNSGVARIHLSRMHPGSLKLVHVFPALFTVGVLLLSLLATLFKHALFLFPLIMFAGAVFLESLWKNKNIHVAMFSIASSFVQLTGYGLGFLKAFWKVVMLKQKEYFAFKESFYK